MIKDRLSNEILIITRSSQFNRRWFRVKDRLSNEMLRSSSLSAKATQPTHQEFICISSWIIKDVEPLCQLWRWPRDGRTTKVLWWLSVSLLWDWGSWLLHRTLVLISSMAQYFFISSSRDFNQVNGHCFLDNFTKIKTLIFWGEFNHFRGLKTPFIHIPIYWKNQWRKIWYFTFIIDI